MQQRGKRKWKQPAPERIRPGLYRRGGKIYARVWVNNKRTYRCTNTNMPSVAERVLQKFQADEAMRQNGIKPDIPALERKATINKIIDDYIAARYPDNRMRPKRASTVNNERKCFDRLRPYFGQRIAADLALADCDRYRQWRIGGGYKYRRMGKLYSKSVGNRVIDIELQTLSNALNVAVRNGILRVNPLVGRTPYHREEDTRHCREVAPTPEQLRLIDQHLRAKGLVVFPDCILFLAFSGLRVTEGLRLLWTDIDWENGIINVERQKRGINPWVPILPEMDQLLKAMKLRATSRYLFPSLYSNEKPIPYSTVAHQLRHLCKSTKMKHVTLHGLRSFFVTQCRQAGITDADIAALIGDKSGPMIIARTYGDVRPDHLMAQAKRVRLLAAGWTIASASDNPAAAAESHR